MPFACYHSEERPSIRQHGGSRRVSLGSSAKLCFETYVVEVSPEDTYWRHIFFISVMNVFIVVVTKREHDDAKNERDTVDVDRGKTEARLYVLFYLYFLKGRGGWMLRSCRNVQRIFVLILYLTAFNAQVNPLPAV